MKPWSYTFRNCGLVHGPGFPFSMASWFGTCNKQLPVCCVVMIIWGCGRWKNRSVSLEGEIPHQKLLGEVGPQVHSPVEGSCLEESLVTHTRASSMRASGYSAAEPTLQTPSNTEISIPKWVGTSPGATGLGLSQLCDIRQIINLSESWRVSSVSGNSQIEDSKALPGIKF